MNKNKLYVEIHFQDQILKTKSIDDGGKNPKWNETFKLNIADIEE